MDTKRKKTVIIPLCLGSLYDNCGTGDLVEPRDGAAARFDASIRHALCNEDALIVSTGGYAKFSPRKVVVGTCHVSLADQFMRYAKEFHKFWADRMIATPLGYGTSPEIRLGIKLAIRSGFVTKDEEADLVVASNCSHLYGRIKRIYVKMYCPKKWTVKYEVAKHPFSLKSHVRELGGLIVHGIYAIKVKRRLDRILHIRHMRKLAEDGLIPPFETELRTTS